MISAWASRCNDRKRGDELFEFAERGRANFVARRAVESQFDGAVAHVPGKRLARENLHADFF